MTFGHCVLDSQIDVIFDLVYSGLKITISAITKTIHIRFSMNWLYRCSWVISRSNLHMDCLDLIFDQVYSRLKITVSTITQKFLSDFHWIDYVDAPGWYVGYLDLVYSGREIIVSKITSKILIRFSLSWIYRWSWVISKSSSHMGYLGLISDLVYSRRETTINMITYRIA